MNSNTDTPRDAKLATLCPTCGLTLGDSVHIAEYASLQKQLEEMKDEYKRQMDYGIRQHEIAQECMRGQRESQAREAVLRGVVELWLDGADCSDWGEEGIDHPRPISHKAGNVCLVCISKAALSQLAPAMVPLEDVQPVTPLRSGVLLSEF